MKDNTPAFPVHGTMGEVISEGMDLRDYFAAKAMHSLLVTHANSRGWSKDAVASQAYKMADAMIAERNKP